MARLLGITMSTCRSLAARAVGFLRSPRSVIALAICLTVLGLLSLSRRWSIDDARPGSLTLRETELAESRKKACEVAAGRSAFVYRYALVLDAGSSGSRVHGYKFDVCTEDKVKPVEEFFKSVRPGLSSFATLEPKAAAASLRPLLDAAIANVPHELHSCTPVQLRATAGMRLLEPAKAAAILLAVHEMLHGDYPFPPVGTTVGAKDAVAIMDGRDEGLLAWVTIMALLPVSEAPAGVASIDLGGASAQLVFEPGSSAAAAVADERAAGYFAELWANGKPHTVYQHSFLRYGLHEALQRLHEHEDRAGCFGPKRNPNACTGVARRALFSRNPNVQSDKCTLGPCLISGVFQPPVPTQARIIAFSYFYDLLSPRIQGNKVTRRKIASLLPQACSIDQLEQKLPKDTDVGLTHESACAAIAYLDLLLEHFGLSDDREITISRNLGRFEVGWWLGVALQMAHVYSQELLLGSKNHISDTKCTYPGFN